ncbi:hypothetical protein C8R44DRAFT_771537 [Mycena epipterygia]|nr:hypothetical protein C8R44DRAFT_771537 [Mycena epipterygia]
MPPANRSASRSPLQNDAVNSYAQPHPSLPPQARARQYPRPAPAMMPNPYESQVQPQPSPLRQPSQRSRPDQQPVLQRQRSRPDQQPVLQRQPSRPDQPYQGQRPNQQYQEQRQYQEQPPKQPLQRQPSRPDQHFPEPPQQGLPMADPYVYNELPMQPVAPAFVRAPSAPQAPPFPQSDSQSTLYSPSRLHPENMLIRGNSDDELDKSDVFWRRFNASAAQQQQPDIEKSSWLEKNEGKSSRYSRRIWVIGLFFVLLAAGGIGIGVFLSFKNNSSNSTRPDAIGGAADITSGVGGTAAGPTGINNGDITGTATSSSLHVSPTNTVP